MTTPAMDASLVEEAVDNLVSQFSSSLDFYRELVQNSIDAGTSTVDVWLEWIPGTATAKSAIAVHVDDGGDGMTEAIIDDQLTSLYSSSKEGDLTKIGKFGIGFVSVFAPKPAAVIVHTGRDGEYWEVFFHADRSFTKTRIAGPVEGTKLTMILEGDRGAYDEFVERTRATLQRWCAHSEVEITLHDRSPPDGVDRGPQPIRTPFTVEGDCRVVVELEQTTIVMAYAERPEYGFYNRGLALLVTRAPQDVLETRTARYGRIAFKVKSRWLEHTLSRETVMRDANLERTLGMLDDVAAGPLRAALLARLATLASGTTWGLGEQDEYLRLLAHLAAEPSAGLLAAAQAPVLRTVDGRATSLSAVERCADPYAYIADRPSALSRALAEVGVPVLLGPRPIGDAPRTDPVSALVVAYLALRDDRRLITRLRSALWEPVDVAARARTRVCDPADVLVAIRVVESPDAVFSAMADAANEMLKRLGHGYAAMYLGAIEGADHRVHLCAVARELAPTMPIPNGSYLRTGRERPCVVLHREHPHLVALRRLFVRHPRHGAYALAKSLLLVEDQLLHRDAELIRLAQVLPISPPSDVAVIGGGR
jgi:hypothetical protein